MEYKARSWNAMERNKLHEDESNEMKCMKA